MSMTTTQQSGLYGAAFKAAFTKLDPRSLRHNPVMFVTAAVAALTTILAISDAINGVDDIGDLVAANCLADGIGPVRRGLVVHRQIGAERRRPVELGVR